MARHPLAAATGKLLQGWVDSPLGEVPAFFPVTRADYAKGLSGVFEGSHLFHGVHVVNHLTTIAGFVACKHNLDALVKAGAKVA